jgi:energy-coupling factor transporter ATP-binding protein EcfA2
MASIKIQDLSYSYPESNQLAIQKVNLEITEGEFVVVAGSSGSGKSTLLRILARLIPDFYNGKIAGAIYLDNQPLDKLSKREMAEKVGIVFQNPESQLVMMKVEQEIVFGMENRGLSDRLMRRRLMEVSSMLGLGDTLTQVSAQLSAGYKQRVALAGVLAMQPEILLLDEPTSQLDPIAGEAFLNLIRKLNQDNGITVILVEQHLEKCCHLADRIILMDKGRITVDLSANQKGDRDWLHHLPLFRLPLLARVFAEAGWPELPLTVKEGRELLRRHYSVPASEKPVMADNCELAKYDANSNEVIADIKNLWFTYPNGLDALKNINLSIRKGDFIAILGENGAGKSTLLKNVNGLLKPGRGQVIINGRNIKGMMLEDLASEVAYLSQNPNDYLFMPSVREELDFSSQLLKTIDLGYRQYLIDCLKLSQLMESSPRDLSVGERQRVAIASVLLANPQLLLLDEPTRGLDYQTKQELGILLKQQNEEGRTIILVTHDIDFAAEYANSIVLMHNGAVVEQGNKYEVLQHALYYSPQIARLFNPLKINAITFREAVIVLREIAKIKENQKESVE